MIRIHEIRLTIDQPKDKIADLIIKKLHIRKEELITYRIFKESIDARKNDMIYFNYCVDCEVKNEQSILQKPSHHYQKTPDFQYVPPAHGSASMTHRPIIIGFGPAGMLAALLLAQEGYEPLIFERGDCVENRILAVEEFWQTGTLQETTNVQFGEGGAGTFSDGKLTTRVKDLRSRKVLEELVAHGAPEEILYESNPHIGTDKLRGIVKSIRENILSLGGEIHFLSPVTDFQFHDDKISAVAVNKVWYPCGDVILAIGHSARDTFRLLYKQNMNMNAKAFAIGARIEHLQSFINERQYGAFANHPRLPVASYRFVHKAKNNRGVYTFCMCPGGVVVPSASSQGHLVVNGMSAYARDEQNANSAILVQVTPDDYGSHPLDGINFQEELEHKAFVLGGSKFQAPGQTIEDFLKQKKHGTIDIKPSYALGIKYTDLHELFPADIAQAMEEGILAFDKKMPGFAKHAILTAIETRSSSPVRIERDSETLQSLNKGNVYPCGEGAGYAGGIVSAAIDGLRCAEKIIEKYSNQRK